MPTYTGQELDSLLGASLGAISPARWTRRVVTVANGTEADRPAGTPEFAKEYWRLHAQTKAKDAESQRAWEAQNRPPTPLAAYSADYTGARCTDYGGIDAWHNEGRPQDLKPATPHAPSRVKPAITGLDCTAPEDHRLGRWKP